MNRLLIDIDNILQVLEVYDKVKIYRADSEGGTYVEITDSSTRIPIIPEKEQYYYDDPNGENTHWYKTAYFNSTTSDESAKSSAIQGGAVPDKVGWTFGNYTPPPGEWGELYTADDMRHTFLFGIDCIGSDIAKSEWSDEQFRQVVREAVSEFEANLTMDIRKKVYVTQPAETLVRGRYWRQGVDYTDEDDAYEFDPAQWRNYGFVQLRHWPVISVERAVLYSPLGGSILDLKERNWVGLTKKFGQVNCFPRSQISYGPWRIYGMPWLLLGDRYPNALQFDYTTGYPTAEFVPDSMRDVIAKWAAIKSLAVVGDGLIAGFSSQSVSLDGLSESFSSTQSATSAYFGARILQYQKEIKEFLERNRYKFSSIPMSFVGV